MKHTSLLPVSIFTVAYLLVATAFAFVHQNKEFLFYIAVVVIIGGAIFAIHKRANFSAGLLWALSIWGLLHMLGGLVPIPDGWPVGGKQVLYSLWLIPGYIKYDNPIHAYGFFVATWACWEALSHTVKNIRSTFGILTLCALAGMGLGAMNEIVEFMATIMIPGTNVGGYENTGWDLVSNLIGSVLMAGIIAWNNRK